MPLRFNTLLQQANIAPAAVRLLRHQDSRAARGRTPYELWRDDRPAFESYQGGQSFQNRSKLRGDYWASFVATPSGETLLAGFYRCRYLGVYDVELVWPHAVGSDLPGTCDVYDLSLDERFNDLAGRLVIEWGNAERAWIQRADKQDKVVLQVHLGGCGIDCNARGDHRYGGPLEAKAPKSRDGTQQELNRLLVTSAHGSLKCRTWFDSASLIVVIAQGRHRERPVPPCLIGSQLKHQSGRPGGPMRGARSVRVLRLRPYPLAGPTADVDSSPQAQALGRAKWFALRDDVRCADLPLEIETNGRWQQISHDDLKRRYEDLEARLPQPRTPRGPRPLARGLIAYGRTTGSRGRIASRTCRHSALRSWPRG